MFHPAWPKVDLAMLKLHNSDRCSPLIENHTTGVSRSLINRYNIFRHKQFLKFPKKSMTNSADDNLALDLRIPSILFNALFSVQHSKYLILPRADQSPRNSFLPFGIQFRTSNIIRARLGFIHLPVTAHLGLTFPETNRIACCVSCSEGSGLGYHWSSNWDT